MKLFYFLALEATAARRPKVKDECDRAHLPDIEHGEWFCKYDGVESDASHPEECFIVCNDGFVDDESGSSFARCHLNKRKNDETWFPNPRRRYKYTQCVGNATETCDDIPESKDLTFFLLNNAQSQGVDGYSDDDLPQPELQAMFSGTIPIPGSLESTDKWMMFIDFGATDSGVDISGVKFESVNAVVVDQTTRFLILRHREYNGDISDVRKIDLQGRSYDPTESHTLANLKHSPVLLFSEYYWNTECVTFNEPFDSYCDFLRKEAEFFCTDPTSLTCRTAKALYNSICGPFSMSDPDEGSGSSGYEGSGADGIISAHVEI